MEEVFGIKWVYVLGNRIIGGRSVRLIEIY